MNAETFAEWQRSQGYKVVRTSTSYWVEAGPRFYQAFPYHWLIQPDETELQQLLRENKAIGLRYSTPFTSAQGMASYHVVFEGGSYSLDTLPKKARHDVRKGLDFAVIEPIPFTRLATEGWDLRCETLERQGRAGSESQTWWRKLCARADDLPGFEAWGAISDGRLLASLLAFMEDGYASILYQQSRTENLSQGINNALAFVFVRQVVERSEAGCVFYGLHSLDAPASVDRFKFRMRFIAKPVRQRVVFHPWFEPFINRASYAMLKAVFRWQPNSYTLTKAEGLVRFFLEGKRPLQVQDWPQPLQKRREELLSL